MFLDLIEQFERVTTRAIPLVDEGDDRNLPIATDLEQFAGLGFDALRTVEHHDRGVGCREHAIGVLGEVTVARRVEQVEDLLAIRKLEHGRSDRDTALLLEFHPVRGGGSTIALRLHRPGTAGEYSAIEQELFGERRLARVGVRDDRERSTSGGLSRRDGHALRLRRPAREQRQPLIGQVSRSTTKSARARSAARLPLTSGRASIA